MPLNFNVDPYYDDFDPAKNYHRILFKPGFAVQARELTQSQTILQDQITKFADNIFKQNSPVTGGQITTNFNAYYIKLQQTISGSTIDVDNWNGKLIQSDDGNVLAKVIAVAQPTGISGVGEPPTLIVVYRSGQHFGNDEIIYDNADKNSRVRTVINESTGLSSVASIAQGVFYISGNYQRADGITVSTGTFVQVNPQTIIIDKYDNTPSKRIGLNITETIQDYVGDTSLLDPAIGASNYQAPGADRYLITLTLESRPLNFGDDDGFIELVRCVDGELTKLVTDSVYNVIDDYFAKRDYETNGDYVVNDFKLTPKTNANTDLYTIGVGKGLAYVHGYRIENASGVDLVSTRARTKKTENNNKVYFNYGSYFYVDSVRGSGGSFFDTTTYGQVDLHCTDSANVLFANTSVYNSTLVASANVRGLVYDSSTNLSDANTFVYKIYVTNLQNSTQSANATGGTTNTITLPSYFSRDNKAYVGVDISITNGTSAGDFRTITSYNGTTKVATVNQNWTVTPTTSSVFVLNFNTKDIQSVLSASKTSYPATLLASSRINSSQGKNKNNETELQNQIHPELVFTVGSPFVSTVTDSSYTTQQEWRNQTFAGSGGVYSTSLSYTDDPAIVKHIGEPGTTLSADFVRENFTIIVTDKQSSNLNVGDNLPWTSLGGTVSLDATGKIATLSIPPSATINNDFKATVISKVDVVNGNDLTGKILKSKYLIQANTLTLSTSNTTVATNTYVDDNYQTSKGQVFIKKAGLVTPGTKQPLYLSDVKRIVKIIDTGSSSAWPSIAMLSNPAYDVTYKYNFENQVVFEGTEVIFPNPKPIEKGIAAGRQLVYTDDNIVGIDVSGEYWGFLDDLYVNFDFAKGILETKNFLIKDAVYQILNGMASAAGGLWDFQILESDTIDGNETELRIVDMNLTNEKFEPPIATFDVYGVNSIFMDASLDFTISGNRMGQVVGNRLDSVTNGSQTSTKGQLFATGLKDKILDKINFDQAAAKGVVDKTTKPASGSGGEEEEKLKQKNLQIFLSKIGIFPRVEITEKTAKGSIDKISYIASLDDLALFESIKIGSDYATTPGTSVLFDIGFSFTIHGISGMKCGDKFKVIGIPKGYERGGFFQITAIKHHIQDMTWKTEVTGHFRINQTQSQ